MCWVLPLLMKLSRSFNPICQSSMVVVLLQPINPFHLTSLILRASYAQLTLYRSKGRWKLTKLNHSSLFFKSLRSTTDLLPPQPRIILISYAAKGKASALSSNILPSLISANITFISFITTAHNPSFFSEGVKKVSQVATTAHVVEIWLTFPLCRLS